MAKHPRSHDLSFFNEARLPAVHTIVLFLHDDGSSSLKTVSVYSRFAPVKDAHPRSSTTPCLVNLFRQFRQLTRGEVDRRVVAQDNPPIGTKEKLVSEFLIGSKIIKGDGAVAITPAR